MRLFGDQVLQFFEKLGTGPEVPQEVEVLYPHQQDAARRIMQDFYTKFYSDSMPRVFLIGINPGRLGAGITGVPFTDPIRLKDICNIDNTFDRKAELSSKFIYQMIAACGGVENFYGRFYFTSVSPLGFTRGGKNLNYYDIKTLQEGWEGFMVDSLRKQISFGAHEIAFSLGQGKNHKYLQTINKKYHLFKEVIPLPHPRWVMQYRLKRLDEFISLYQSSLQPFTKGH